MTALRTKSRSDAASESDVRCLTCGSVSRFAFSLAHAPVYRCTDRACGLQFASPQPTDDELAAAYAEAFSAAGAPLDHGSTPEPFARALLGALAARIGPLAGRRVLDYGAGIGTITGLLVEAGADVVAVELHPAGRNRIAAKFDNPIVADLEGLRSLDDRRPFDLVVMVEVIEHLRSPRADLAALRGFLREGGHLFLTTPNIASLRSRVQGTRWYNVATMTHLMYFDQRSLPRTLQAAGFTDVEPLKTASFFPGWGLPRRLLQRVLIPLNLDGGLQVVARR